MPLVKHRVGETVDVEEARRLAREMSLNRAAEFLGVNWSTLYRVAWRHGIQFRRRWHYGWRGIRG